MSFPNPNRPSPRPRTPVEPPEQGRHRAVLGRTPPQHLASRFIGDREMAQRFARRSHAAPEVHTSGAVELVQRIHGGAA